MSRLLSASSRTWMRRVAWTTCALVTVVSAPTLDAAPVVAHDFAQTLEDTIVDIDVLANDHDPAGHPLTVVAVTSPIRGVAWVDDAGAVDIVRFAPAPDHSGVDFFRYTVANPDGEIASARVTVAITAVDDPPVAEGDQVTTDEEIGVSIAVLANDRDPEYAPLDLVAVGPAASGTPRIDPDRTIFYTPDLDVFGVDSFIYTISDGTHESTAVVLVTIRNRPDRPIAVDDAATSTGAPVVLDVLANDRDPDGEQLTVIAVARGQGGTVELLSGGRVRFTPAPRFEGEAFFDYRIADPGGLQDGAIGRVQVEREGHDRESGG